MKTEKLSKIAELGATIQRLMDLKLEVNEVETQVDKLVKELNEPEDKYTVIIKFHDNYGGSWKIPLIKILREETDFNLKDAKEIIEKAYDESNYWGSSKLSNSHAEPIRFTYEQARKLSDKLSNHQSIEFTTIDQA